MTRQRVTNHGQPRKYWTQVPNLVDDSDLDPFARTLYTHYLRIAGQHDGCEETVRESAERCHMSQGSVLKARRALVDGGWIAIEDFGTHGRGADLRIHLLDRWGENMARYGPVVDSELGNAQVVSISDPEAKRSGGEAKRSPDEQFSDKCSPPERDAHHLSITNSLPFLTGEDVKNGDVKTQEPERARAARPGQSNGRSSFALKDDDKPSTNGHMRPPSTGGRAPPGGGCWKCDADVDEHAIQGHPGPCDFTRPTASARPKGATT